MRNKETRQLMKAFLVNPKVKMQYPITGITSQFDSVIVFINLEKLGEDTFEPFGIRQMDTVLNVIDVYNEPNVELTPSNIIITTDKDKQEIRTASQEMTNLIKSPKYEALKTIETNTTMFEKIMEVEISKSDLSSKLKVQRLLGLEILKIEADGDATLSVCNMNGQVTDNEAKSEINGSGNGTFILNVEDIGLIPIMDYNVKVYKNTQNGAQISIWRLPEHDAIEIIITEKQN